MEKLIEFYNKRKMIIILTTITTLLFFAGLFSPLWIVALGFVLLFYLTCNFGEILSYTLYFSLFSNIGTFYVYSLIAGFVVIVGKYVWGLIKKQEKFFAVPFCLTTFIAVVFSCIHYKFDSLGFEQGILAVALLYAMYFAFVYKRDIDVKKCFEFVMLGIVCSAVVSVLTLPFDTYSCKIFYFDGQYKRLQLLCFHQNHLAMVCGFAISYCIYQIVNGEDNWKFALIKIALCLVVGLLTLSKAFMLVCMGFAIYVCIWLVIKFKTKSLYFILSAIAVVVVGCFVFKDLLMKILDRFLAYNTEDSIFNRITTGRSSIWSRYLDEISSSALKLLFGVGLFNAELLVEGTHNVFIHLLYRMGIVGVLLLIALAVVYVVFAQNKPKITFFNMLLFVTYVVFSLNEMIFSDRFFIFLILGLMLLKKPETQKIETEQIFDNQNNKKAKIINHEKT